MYTIEEITDANGLEFDSLFSTSVSHMDNGTFSWNFLGNPTTEQEKKEALRNRINELLDQSSEPVGRGVLWKKDGTPIHLAVGTFNTVDSGEYITFVYSLFGPDANGSKSFLYDNDYLSATKDFFINTFNVIGYKISCVNNCANMDYHLNKPRIVYDVSVDKVYTSGSGVELATISYTYK
jgi:hypothetical protein